MTAWWLPLTVFAYVSFAVSGALDKIIVGKKAKDVSVVSFYVAVLGLGAVWMVALSWLPFPWAEGFKFTWPQQDVLWLVLFAGLLLQLSLYTMYVALKYGEATRVISTIGASTPIFALGFAMAILGETFPPIAYLAFAFLIGGAMMISVRRGGHFDKSFWLALLSAGFAALQTVLTKMVYGQHPFIPSFILLCFGGGLFALWLYVSKRVVREDVALTIRAVFHPKKKARKKASKKQGKGTLFWVMVNTVAGSAGVMALNVALVLGPASGINALRSVQYAAIFLIALVLSHKVPQLLKEELTGKTISQKVLAIGVIAVGVVLLTMAGK